MTFDYLKAHAPVTLKIKPKYGSHYPVAAFRPHPVHRPPLMSIYRSQHAALLSPSSSSSSSSSVNGADQKSACQLRVVSLSNTPTATACLVKCRGRRCRPCSKLVGTRSPGDLSSSTTTSRQQHGLLLHLLRRERRLFMIHGRKG